MKYNVRITNTAKRDLRDIAVWIAKNMKSVDFANQFVNEIKEKCKLLDTFPDAGAFPDDHILRSAGYRFITHKEYLIFYMIDENQKNVDIMAVFNSKKDYTRVMGRAVYKDCNL